MFKNFRGVPGITPSRGALNGLMKRLLKTYQFAGGEEFGGEDDEVAGLSKFDALKILISKKIEITRKTIKDVDDAKTINAKAKKKQDVRNMIKNIESDFSSIKKEHEKFKKPTFKEKLFRQQKDEKQIKNQEKDVKLIGQHVEEVIQLSKRKYQRNVKRRKKIEDIFVSTGNESKGEKGGSDDDSDDESSLSNVVVEIPSDPTQSELPAIDISAQMQKIKKNKDQLKDVMTTFEKKLEVIKQQALDMGDQIDQGKEILKDIEVKVEDRTNDVSKLNKQTEKAKTSVNQTTKIVIIIVIIVALIIAICVIYFVLVQMGFLNFSIN